MTLGPRIGPGVHAGPRVRLDAGQRDAIATRTVELPTAADTAEFGAHLGAVLHRGDLVVLTGPLGAGKTALTQGIGAGMGVQGRVASPTFVIARVHPAASPERPALVHVDAYRLGSFDEVDDLDLDVDMASSVVVVEWGAGLVERLAPTWLEITLDGPAQVDRGPADTDGGPADTDGGPADTDGRTATLAPHGGDWAERLDRLVAELG